MRLIISTMKDEGPFILEWISYYLSIGFTHFLVASNDCSDGTDKILKRLEKLGIVAHLDNPGPWPQGPQGGAYEKAMAHPWYKEAEWILVCDADEFLDIRVGDNTLDALFAEVPDATLFSFVWQLFGHGGQIEFEDGFVTERMTRAADPRQIHPKTCRAFKTLFKNDGVFSSISTHRPKRPDPARRQDIRWVDGDGDSMNALFPVMGWSFTNTGLGFGDRLGRMNHYAVRSLDNYLMKRLRGDVNTTSFHKKMEESGESYWKLHCWNTVEETSILSKLPRAKERLAELRKDRTLSRLHREAVAFHLSRIEEISRSEAAVDFRKKFSGYRGGPVVKLSTDALTCETSAISAAHFVETDFVDRNRWARAKQVGLFGVRGRAPWFANLDALDTPLEKAPARDLAARLASEDPAVKAELPNVDLKLNERPEPTRRQVRQLRTAMAFLGELAPKGSWMLIGGRNVELIEAMLDIPTLDELHVIEPFGFTLAELVTAKVQRTPDRTALDREYFAMAHRFRDPISEGRLKVVRGVPSTVLKLHDPGAFRGALIHHARREAPMENLLNQLRNRIRRNGYIVSDAYHLGTPAGRGVVAAVNRFVGARPGRVRVHAVDEPMIALQRLS
jgi:hypothetical protein